jgi:hypothetical protein
MTDISLSILRIGENLNENDVAPINIVTETTTTDTRSCVGILTNPSGKYTMDISGTINCSALLVNDNAVSFGGSASVWDLSDSNTISYLDGNVGIGSDDPIYELDVSGTTNTNTLVTSNLTFPHDQYNTDAWNNNEFIIERKFSRMDIDPIYAWDFRVSTRTNYYDYVNNIKAVATDVTSSDNSGAYFNGSSAGITLNTDGYITTGGQSETFEFVFSLDDTTNSQRIFVFYGTATGQYNYDMYVLYNSTNSLFDLYFDTGHFNTQDVYLVDSSINPFPYEYHVMISLDYISSSEVNIQIYLNTSLKLDTTSVHAQDARVRTMNLGHRDNNVYMQGYIRYFRIWQGTAFTSSSNLYNSRHAIYPQLSFDNYNMTFSANGEIAINSDVAHDDIQLNVLGSMSCMGGTKNNSGLVIHRDSGPFRNPYTNRQWNITKWSSGAFFTSGGGVMSLGDLVFNQTNAGGTHDISYNSDKNNPAMILRTGSSTGGHLIVGSETYGMALSSSGTSTLLGHKYNYTNFTSDSLWNIMFLKAGQLILNSYGDSMSFGIDGTQAMYLDYTEKQLVVNSGLINGFFFKTMNPHKILGHEDQSASATTMYNVLISSAGTLFLNSYGEMLFRVNNTTYMRLYSTGSLGLYGSVSSNNTAVLSDDRLKHNEEKISNALGLIQQLDVKKYLKTREMYEEDFMLEQDSSGNYVNLKENDSVHTEVGVIAQDIEKIEELSFLVTQGEDTIPENYNEEEKNEPWTPTPKSLDYNSLFCVALQAIQELKTEKDVLESKYNELLERVNILENRSV